MACFEATPIYINLPTINLAQTDGKTDVFKLIIVPVILYFTQYPMAGSNTHEHA